MFKGLIIFYHIITALNVLGAFYITHIITVFIVLGGADGAEPEESAGHVFYISQASQRNLNFKFCKNFNLCNILAFCKV